MGNLPCSIGKRMNILLCILLYCSVIKLVNCRNLNYGFSAFRWMQVTQGDSIECWNQAKIQKSYKTHISYQIHPDLMQVTYRAHTNFIQHKKIIQNSCFIQITHTSHTNLMLKSYKLHSKYDCIRFVLTLYFCP